MCKYLWVLACVYSCFCIGFIYFDKTAESHSICFHQEHFLVFPHISFFFKHSVGLEHVPLVCSFVHVLACLSPALWALKREFDNVGTLWLTMVFRKLSLYTFWDNWASQAIYCSELLNILEWNLFSNCLYHFCLWESHWSNQQSIIFSR